jgi:hypothetical protein
MRGQKFTAALSSAYQASRSPEEWTTQRDAGRQRGAERTRGLVREFDPSEKGMARVRKLGLTPAQEESDVYRDFMATVARDRADEYWRGGEAAAKERPERSTVRIVGKRLTKMPRSRNADVEEYGDPTDPKRQRTSSWIPRPACGPRMRPSARRSLLDPG